MSERRQRLEMSQTDGERRRLRDTRDGETGRHGGRFPDQAAGQATNQYPAAAALTGPAAQSAPARTILALLAPLLARPLIHRGDRAGHSDPTE